MKMTVNKIIKLCNIKTTTKDVINTCSNHCWSISLWRMHSHFFV